MKFILFLTTIFLGLALIVYVLWFNGNKKELSNNESFVGDQTKNEQVETPYLEKTKKSSTSTPKKAEVKIIEPLALSESRIIKKPFGLYVTPEKSPVQPEKFSGWHNAVDYEILPGEENKDVEVSAICTGILKQITWIRGYGGVVIQDCVINGQTVTVLYGHVSLASINIKPGQDVSTSTKFAILGKGYSQDTDGERKHLHLGIHRGDKTDYRGYVSTKKQLEDWLDPEAFLRKLNSEK